jgi:hypothetical protein
MKTIITSENDRLNKYPDLFGTQIIKGMPLFSYAEHLFYNGMSQMISSYSGGYFDFVEITEADVEIEPSTFIPLITNEEDVLLETPFGTSATLSYKAGSLVVWLFVVEQLAQNANNDVMERLYSAIQDIKHCYDGFVDEQGNKLFSESDCVAIYNLTN